MRNLILWIIYITMTHSASGQYIAPEFVNINGVDQWIYYMGSDTSKPVILFLHGGPGTTETPFLEKYNHNLKEHFVVACWEQRGAGKSYHKGIPDSSMSMAQFILDAHTVTQYIKAKFNRSKIYLMGHSWGTLLGIRTIKAYPQDYSAYFAIAQTSDASEEEKLIYEWLMEQAMNEPNSRAIKQLNKIGPPKAGQRLSFKDMSTKINWVNYYGGASFYQDKKGFNKLAKTVIKAKMYSFRDKLKYLKSEKYTLSFLYDEIAEVNLKKEIKSISVPIVFFHGSGDYQVPVTVAKDYYDFISAPYKNFIEFDQCAHGVLIEYPEQFKNELLKEIEKINALSLKR